MPTLNANNTSFFFAESGRGLPLVLLHAFPTDSRMWDAQVAELGSRCRVIAPDFRGFGRSPAAGPFTVASMADDVHMLLAELGALPCVLAGISMGGYVAMHFAHKYPSNLRGLVLLDTKAEADTPEQRQNRDRQIEVARTQGSAAVADLLLDKMLAPDTPAHRPQIAKALRALMESCPPETIQHGLAALRDRPDMTAAVAKVAVPTLLIVGDGDAITPPRMMEGLRQRIAGAEMHVVRGAGHISPMEQPAQVNRALRRFLDAAHL